MVSSKIFLFLCAATCCHSDPVRPYEPSQSFHFPQSVREHGTKGTRSTKSFVFPESSSQRKPSTSGFRPSKALSFPEAANFDILSHENLPTTTTTPAPVRIPDAEIPHRQGKAVVTEDPTELTFRNPEGKGSALTESDVVEAMETLVERLDTFELRMSSIENSLLNFELNAVAADDLSLVKRELDDGMTNLLERNAQLEKQMQFLEEFYREHTNPKLFAARAASVEQQSSAVDHCPENFFSLNQTDSNSPCYHISSQVQHRKNWQEAVASCQKIGAKLAEPQSVAELQLLTNYLLTRDNQIGGGYWTGGINPGLLWLWSISGNPVSNIPAEFWLTSPEINDHEDEVNTNCLRLSYDRNLLRYGFEGSECKRYLYFVCEYNVDGSTQGRSNNLLLKLLLQSAEVSSETAPETAPEAVYDIATTPATTTPTPETTTPFVFHPNYVGVVGFKTPSENTTAVHSGSDLTVFDS